MIPRSPHSKGLNIVLGRHMPGHMKSGPLFGGVFFKLSITAELAPEDTFTTHQPSEQYWELEQVTWCGLEPVDVSSD